MDTDLSVMENNELLLNLAKKIKQLRKVKGVTQEQARTDTGIHIARIEQGKRDISYTTLVKLSEYFGVDLNAFL